MVFRFQLVLVFVVLLLLQLTDVIGDDAERSIQQYVTIVLVPNATDSTTVNGDGSLSADAAAVLKTSRPIVVNVPEDTTDFCQYHGNIFNDEPLQALCKDFVGSRFPRVVNIAGDPVQYDSDEVFLFANAHSGKIINSTKFVLNLKDDVNDKTIIVPCYGNWDLLSIDMARDIVSDIAGERKLQTYTGRPVRKPRYTSLVVSDANVNQFTAPTIIHLPADTTDICFRLRHLFTTERIMKTCVDAVASQFSFPNVRFDVNEIFLFISEDTEKIESFNQVSWMVDDAKLGRVVMQCFGNWVDGDANIAVKFVNDLHSTQQLQSFAGSPPMPPTRLFTMIISETIADQFVEDKHVVLAAPSNRTLLDTFCRDMLNVNSSLVVRSDIVTNPNSTLEKQCNRMVDLLRYVPHPITELNERVHLNEVFMFLNNDVSLSDLLQFGFKVEVSNPNRVSYVQVFGKWGELDPEQAKQVVMSNGLIQFSRGV